MQRTFLTRKNFSVTVTINSIKVLYVETGDLVTIFSDLSDLIVYVIDGKDIISEYTNLVIADKKTHIAIPFFYRKDAVDLETDIKKKLNELNVINESRAVQAVSG